MEVFRISHEKYANNLSSSGSANRWNRAGQQVLYTGASRSLSSLELVVHRAHIRPRQPYRMMVISLADEDGLFRTVKTSELPERWRGMDAYGTLQEIGSEWYLKRESLVLKVPSAVIPQEYNYVINCEHELFADKVQLVRTESYFWDGRLL